jgi:hypothetical protein
MFTLLCAEKLAILKKYGEQYNAHASIAAVISIVIIIIFIIRCFVWGSL